MGQKDKRSIISAKINEFGVVFTVLLLLTSTASAMHCPVECQCSIHGISVLVDCSGLGLRQLPEMDPAMEINWLDLSDNLLTEFPASLANFPSIESLDLSYNEISSIPADALAPLQNLRTLTLNRNNITNWQDIHPNELLVNTMVNSLHLSGNPLTSFSTTDESLILVSNTLHFLDISKCRITKVNGVGVLEGLTALEYLDMSGNPLRYASNMISSTLLGLDLSNCQLTNLPGDFLSGLTALISLNLARNHRLSLFRSAEEFVASESLTKIDLSYCNMENVELNGFPKLKSAVLHGNLIKDLTRNSFVNNELLQRLQLSSNTIAQMHPETFSHLRHLRELDLSFNLISKLDRELFKANEKFEEINLSRNYIGRFSRIVSPSLRKMNMSSCEIESIDSDALIGLSSLIELDLSLNLIASIPDALQSDTLQMLDLRLCRISSIRNITFVGFPELSRLRLAGNRFTTPFRREFFDQNPYLQEMWLGDNPWRCDCSNREFMLFFRFITEAPTRLFDRSHLRCGSPDEVYGSLWEMACFNVWVQNERPLGTAEKVWTIVLIGLLLFGGGMCLIMTMRKCIEGRNLTRREAEREAFLEEQRDIVRQNRMAMDQQAQLNAPDPRETRPPCYEDALLLPRLDGSFASLNELGQKKEYKLGVHRTPKGPEDIQAAQAAPEPPQISHTNRCRSEEVLSMRDIVANRRSGKYRIPADEPDFETHHYANISRHARRSNSRNRLPTSPPPTRIPTPPPDLPPPPPIPNKPTGAYQSNLDLHYHSTEILSMLPNDGTKRAVPLSPVLSQGSGHSAEYDDLADHPRESPYSRRKSRNLSTFKGIFGSSTDPLPEPDDIIMIEDHYPRMATPQPSKKEDTNSSGSFSITGDETDSFVGVSASDLTNVGKSSKDEEEYAEPDQTAVVVQVHRHPPPKESSL